jgi:uncharacterized protein YndB with AHSA1/START domain
MSTNTVELHRVFKSTTDRVYRAFLTPAAFAKWLPPHGFIGTVHEMDARVGGRYKMLEPGARLRYTAEFDDPNLPGKMQTTVLLREVFCGVEIKIKQEGIPAAIPVEACYLGWQESLQLLAQLVEPEIRQ